MYLRDDFWPMNNLNNYPAFIKFIMGPKTKADLVICPQGHICNMTRQLLKESEDNDITVFECDICHKKGKCYVGRYVCA